MLSDGIIGLIESGKAFPHELAQDMVSLDYHEKLGIVAILGSPGKGQIIAKATGYSM